MSAIHQPSVQPYISPATAPLWADLHPARLALLGCRCAQEKQTLRAHILALTTAIHQLADQTTGANQ